MKTPSDYAVLYADDAIVVVNKRAGMLVAADRYDAAVPRLDAAVAADYGTLFAVHRIDKDTSGAVIYARTQEAHRALSMQFEHRQVKKVYHCLVHGHPLWQDEHVDARLLPDGDARHRTIVNQRSGKEAVTDFHLIGNCGPYSWIEARPQTGRTHQIRVHLKQKGLCIVCDPLYSGNQRPVYLSDIKRKWHGDQQEERPLLSRLALHAWQLGFIHPDTGEAMTLCAPYPRDLEAVRKQLAKLFTVDPLSSMVDGD